MGERILASSSRAQFRRNELNAADERAARCTQISPFSENLHIKSQMQANGNKLSSQTKCNPAKHTHTHTRIDWTSNDGRPTDFHRNEFILISANESKKPTTTNSLTLAGQINAKCSSAAGRTTRYPHFYFRPNLVPLHFINAQINIYY